MIPSLYEQVKCAKSFKIRAFLSINLFIVSFLYIVSFRALHF